MAETPEPGVTQSKEGRSFVQSLGKHTKKLLSIFGAAIIFVTFLINDAKREKMKELADSIDAAENAYIVHLSERATLGELKAFERTFVDFRQHPTKPLKRVTAHHLAWDFDLGDPENKNIDWDTFDLAQADQSGSTELLETVGRLADKLPPIRTIVKEKTAKNAELGKRLSALDSEGSTLEDNKLKQSSEIVAVNHKIWSLSADIFRNSLDVNELSTFILNEADVERKQAEEGREFWEKVFYGLYGLGFLVGMIGLLMEADMEKTVEKVMEEIP